MPSTRPVGNFVVLAASLLAVAVILAGGFAPRVTVSGPAAAAARGNADDPAFD